MAKTPTWFPVIYSHHKITLCYIFYGHITSTKQNKFHEFEPFVVLCNIAQTYKFMLLLNFAVVYQHSACNQLVGSVGWSTKVLAQKSNVVWSSHRTRAYTCVKQIHKSYYVILYGEWGGDTREWTIVRPLVWLYSDGYCETDSQARSKIVRVIQLIEVTQSLSLWSANLVAKILVLANEVCLFTMLFNTVCCAQLIWIY